MKSNPIRNVFQEHISHNKSKNNESSSIYRKKVKTISLKDNIKSSHIIKKIFSFLYENIKYDILKHNKNYQNFFSLNIDSYKKLSGRYKKDGIKGFGQEFFLDNDNLIFEGEYLNGKRNGKGKGLNKKVNIIYELNNNINGKGKEYDSNGKIKFEGEYLNGKKKWKRKRIL